MANFNLLQLYNRAFGYVATPFQQNGASAFVPLGSAFDVQDLGERAPREFNSIFGTPIFMPVVLEIPGLKYKLPNEPVVTINLTKKIVETEIDSNDGNFLEGFSLGNYDVDIDGIVVDENNWGAEEYPEEDMRKIRQILEYKGSVKVYCKQLSLFNINEIAIFGSSFPAMPGEPSVAAYKITAKSDRNFDLEVKKP